MMRFIKLTSRKERSIYVQVSSIKAIAGNKNAKLFIGDVDTLTVKESPTEVFELVGATPKEETNSCLICDESPTRGVYCQKHWLEIESPSGDGLLWPAPDPTLESSGIGPWWWFKGDFWPLG